MARLDHAPAISGTIGGTTYYQMFGRTYMRRKSSLTSKKVLKSKAFEKTRKCAADLGRAAKIGSVVYKALPVEIKVQWMYRAITGEAASLLYKGKTDQEVKDFLWKKYITDTNVRTGPITGSSESEDASKQTNLKLREIFRERWEKQGKTNYYFKQAWQKRSDFYKPNFHEYLAIAERPQNKSTMNR